MFKYIYYRLCKHHEKGKRLNTRTWAASNYAGVMHFMMIWPLAWIFIALLTLICSNPLVCLLAFIPFIIWSEFLTGRFEKRMEIISRKKLLGYIEHEEIAFQFGDGLMCITPLFYV